jgi:ELWxxDGT repeat protein
VKNASSRALKHGMQHRTGMTAVRRHSRRAMLAGCVVETLERRTLLSAALLADINKATASSFPYDFAALNNTTTVFQANDGVHGYELWRTDGTAAGTSLIKDINPGAAGSVNGPPYYSNVRDISTMNGVVYFAANDGVAGTELWRTDGTAAGTTLVADLAAGSASSNPASLTVVGNALYYLANAKLYKLDGANLAAGPTLLANAVAPSNLTAFNGKLYFTGNDSTAGTELWSSDGTTAGTQRVADIDPGAASSSPSNLTVAGSFLYFSANDGVTGTELWRTDGTTAGTQIVKDINSGAGSASPSYLTAVGGFLYFAATGSNGSGGTVFGLWATDGLASETTVVKTFGGISSIAAAGTKVYVSASDGTGLWVSDAGATSASQLFNLQASNLTNVNGKMFFNTINGGASDPYSGTLYTTDGTAGGTIALMTSKVGDNSQPPNGGLGFLTAIGSTLYFAGANPMIGIEPWVSDGTVAGTKPVADVNAALTLGSSPGAGVTFNGRLYFTANDITHGNELWSTDGTTAGTSLLADIDPGTASGNPANLTVVGNTLFFTASDGVAGSELWKTDGTTAGTALVKNLSAGVSESAPSYLTNVNGTLYFADYDPTNGHQLWKSDGTTAGTVIVDPTAGFNFNPENFGVANGVLYFEAYDSTHGNELWESDGTAAGTVLVRDIVSGTTDSAPNDLTYSGGSLYFVAVAPAGAGLYKTDGTAGGTLLIKTFLSGTLANLTDVAGRLFFSANNGSTGTELWTSDGTTAGTVLVKDVNSGANSSYPGQLIAAGSTLFFVASESTDGNELWKSDGTAAGTVLVKDIMSGSGSSYPAGLRANGGTVFFQANDGVTGYELWRSNGTAAGTSLVADVNPGSANSSASVMGVLGTQLIFSADDGIHGAEPWTTSVAAAPLLPTINLSGLSSVNEGSAYTMNFSATDPNAGAALTGWTISWGDGSGVSLLPGTATSATHTFADGPASPKITATVADSVGAAQTATLPITVNNVAPTLNVSGATALYNNQATSLAVSVTDPGTLDSETVDVNWGDGSAHTVVQFTSASNRSATVTHAYASNGSYTQTTTATDKDGGNVSASTTVTVSSPVLTGTGTTISPNEGTGFTGVVGAFTDPGYGALNLYAATVTWGDGHVSAGTIQTTGTAQVFNVVGTNTYANDGTYPVSIAVTRTGAAGININSTANVAVVPPTLQLSGAASVNEGAVYTLGLSAAEHGTDVITGWSINWGDGTSVQNVAGNPPTVTHSYANGPATVSITASATDEDGAYQAKPTPFNVTVNNVAPTASLTGPASGVRGQTRTFTFAATDPSTADTAAGFTYTINWGDGSAVQTVTPTAGNGAGVSVDHVFATTGSYTVSATATDKDGGVSAAASQSIAIAAVAIQTDPNDSTKTALVVGGTTTNDNIQFAIPKKSTSIQVTINGVVQGLYTPTGRIIAFGQAGDDVITVSSGIALTAELFGGDGNDTLTGGGGPNIIVGGNGNDTIQGGTGRNILIGGAGADKLTGGSNDDILVGGSTLYDANIAALGALLAEWIRTDQTYTQRVAYIDGASTGGLNGSTVLSAATVSDDAAIDTLAGKSGSDLFYANISGTIKDSLTDWVSSETKIDIH